MSKHTPGPWRAGVEKPTSKNGHLVFGPKGRGKILVSCEQFMDRGERLANARLAAAAPEMLCALEAARKHIEHGAQSWSMKDPEGVYRCFHCDEFSHLKVWPEHGNPNCETKRILETLNAAITKAGGEAK